MRGRSLMRDIIVAPFYESEAKELISPCNNVRRSLAPSRMKRAPMMRSNPRLKEPRTQFNGVRADAVSAIGYST